MKITSDLYKVHRDLKKTAAHCKIRVVEFLNFFLKIVTTLAILLPSLKKLI